jgi:hypothetical protein
VLEVSWSVMFIAYVGRTSKRHHALSHRTRAGYTVPPSESARILVGMRRLQPPQRGGEPTGVMPVEGAPRALMEGALGASKPSSMA